MQVFKILIAVGLGALASATTAPIPTTLVSLIQPAPPSATTKVPVPVTKTIRLRPSKTTTYPDCGGFRPTPAPPCPEGNICIDDPWRDGCGMACDIPGICVKPVHCGGFAGIACPQGMWCIDDRRDDCDPLNGGADCIGLCV
ncbi:proteinase inhibitor kazal [Colletotrichum sojae]|uniref:Proteinase inhibitor kazal n=1 Tax=Colletotrichum sojae TaxID=2175907 RepID=A0A8H6J6W6_9PEZI|nr:proteinase inhibitor kazal [Colletotrichum sojae]